MQSDEAGDTHIVLPKVEAKQRGVPFQPLGEAHSPLALKGARRQPQRRQGEVVYLS